jgi:integrase
MKGETMSAKRKDLTCHQGIYRAVVGAELIGETRRPKVWYLGKDVREARLRVERIRLVWNTVVLQAKVRGDSKTDAVWTAQFIIQAEAWNTVAMKQVTEAFQTVADFNALAEDGGQVTSEKAVTVLPAPASTTITSKTSGDDAASPDTIDGTLTLIGAAKAFDLKLDADLAGKDRAPSNADRLHVSVKAMLRFIADAPVTDKKHDWKKQSPLAGRTIDTIGYQQIMSLAANMKNRDLNGRAVDTIRTDLQGIEEFFGWLEDSGQWKPQCNYGRLLKCDPSKLKTLAESKKMRSGQDLFSIEELKVIYPKTVEEKRWRLYMLLAMNLVCTQQQISDLQTDDLIGMDTDTPAVNFIRGKTRHLNKGAGVEGRYPLWPETAKALREWLKMYPPKSDYLFTTEKGHRLVRYDAGKNGKTKVDSVRQTWEKLLLSSGAKRNEAGDIRWLGFKHLRKTSADAVAVLAGGGPAGEYFKELSLAHTKNSVASKNYSGAGSADSDFGQVAVFIMQLRTVTFAEMFKADPKPKVKITNSVSKAVTPELVAA